MRVFFSCLLAFLLLCPGLSSFARAEEDPLRLLQKRTAAINSLSADFEQETDIPLFSAPVTSQGRFLYQSPAHLRWEYRKPYRSGFIISGETGLNWEGDQKPRFFKVAENPQASLIFKQISARLRFDPAAAEKEYKVTLTTSSPLTVVLEPRQAEVAAVLRSLTFVFTEEGVAESVTVDEAGGGRTRISFTNVRLNPAIDPGEFQKP